MLLSKRKITQDLISMVVSWRHSGFNVFGGPRLHPAEEDAMENLARYIIPASLPGCAMCDPVEPPRLSFLNYH